MPRISIRRPTLEVMSMKTLRENVSLFIWYLKRPALYRELRRALGRIPNSTRAAREEIQRIGDQAQRWCAEHVSTVANAARELGIPEEVLHLSELHPDEWAGALDAAAACPVKMGGAGHVDFLYHVCLHKRPDRIVETGVAYGWSSLAILLALEENGRGALVSIDMPYPGLDNDAFVGCVVPAAPRLRWKLVRRPDRDALPRVLRELGEIDLAHYDSDKSYRGRAFAYELLWSSLRPGGMLMSDDIGDNFAFRDFAQKVTRTPWVLPKLNRVGTDYAGVLIK